MLLLLFVISWPAESAGEPLGSILRYVSVTEHFSEMVRGIIDTKSLIYFVSMVVGWMRGGRLTAVVIIAWDRDRSNPHFHTDARDGGQKPGRTG